jgi:hypothetical protein
MKSPNGGLDGITVAYCSGRPQVRPNHPQPCCAAVKLQQRAHQLRLHGRSAHAQGGARPYPAQGEVHGVLHGPATPACREADVLSRRSASSPRLRVWPRRAPIASPRSSWTRAAPRKTLWSCIVSTRLRTASIATPRRVLQGSALRPAHPHGLIVRGFACICSFYSYQGLIEADLRFVCIFWSLCQQPIGFVHTIFFKS